MSSKTTNLNLTKPSEDEFYDINVQNENMDIIDREINGLKQPAYEVSTAMSDLNSGEMITVAFGKIAKAVSTLISHVANKSNPHGVTKNQIGLGNVPNVATNDQTPTYTEASSLSSLVSGEKTSVAFGKIAKAVSTLISHVANKSNPHGVTKNQIGLGNVPNVATNDQTPTYTEASSLSSLVSGEKTSVAFGKIAKAVSTLISHTTSKATNSVLGHVKLSDSTSSTSASTAGVAATPKAVKAAYDLANSNTEKLGTTDISGIGDGTVTGAIVNNKEAIEDVSQSLNNSKKTYINLALPNVTADAKAVCDYINKNYLLGQLSPAYTVEFDVVASNADWFSGTLSTDLLTLAQGRTVWGFVQQRTSSAENSTLYKYFASGTGGASSVSAIDETISDPMFCESIPGRNQITDFLNVNLSNRNSDINKIHYFGSDNPATAFTNSPYTAGPFYGYRVVRWCSESANTYHLVTVELHEQYPVSGRVWSNTYDINNGTWYGWKCNQGNTFIDVGTVLKNVTTIAAGATVTYVATRDCFVNVSAYAHGSGQNTKIYINNVCIFNPYTNNGDNAGLVIVDKTVPLKTGQTIKIENGTYTTSSYAIFAAF